MLILCGFTVDLFRREIYEDPPATELHLYAKLKLWAFVVFSVTYIEQNHTVSQSVSGHPTS